MGIFKSLFGHTTEEAEDSKDKEKQRNFDIFKYDGLKAIKIGKTGYAIRCFKEALEIEEEFETLSYLASAYIQQNDISEAIEIYSRMAAIDPDYTETFLNRAQLYLQENQGEASIADCEYILSKNASDYRAYFLMGKAQKILNQPEKAIEALSKAIEIKNDMADLFLLRSGLLAGQKQYDQALEDINTAITLAPEEENAYIQRGAIFEATGNTKAALQDYTTVVELNPFHEQAYLETGRILLAQNLTDEAIRHFDEAIENKPDFGRAYIARGKAKELKGDKTGALEDLKIGAELTEENDETIKQPVDFNDLYANRPL